MIPIDAYCETSGRDSHYGRMASGVGIDGDGVRPHYGGSWALTMDVHNWLSRNQIGYELYWNSIPKLWTIHLTAEDEATRAFQEAKVRLRFPVNTSYQ